MMGCIRLEPVVNGYLVRYDSPEVVERNRQKDSNWTDPEVTVVFEDEEKLFAGLKVLLPKVKDAKDKNDDFDGGLADALAQVNEDSE